MRFEEMSQRLTALVAASAIPAVRWFYPAKPDARNAVSHFRHYNMHIDMVVNPANRIVDKCGLLMLVGEKELCTFAERLGSCSKFTTTPFDQIRDLCITVKLLQPVPAQAALSSRSLQLLDVLRQTWWDFSLISVIAPDVLRSSDLLQQARMEMANPRWSNQDKFVNTLGLEYQKGLDQWDAEHYEVAVAAFLNTERLLALQKQTSKYELDLMASFSMEGLRSDRLARISQFLRLASNISLAGVYIAHAYKLPERDFHKRDHLVTGAITYASIAYAIVSQTDEIAADLAILACIQRSIALALKSSDEKYKEAYDIKRLLSSHNLNILPTALMQMIQMGTWRTKIPEGIVEGVNKTIFIRRPRMSEGNVSWVLS